MVQKKSLLIVLVLVMAAVVLGAGAPAPTPEPTPIATEELQPQSIVDLAGANGRFETLVAALKAAE